jgi:hypothetical protein
MLFMSALEELFFPGVGLLVFASAGADVVQAVAKKQAAVARKSAFIVFIF